MWRRSEGYFQAEEREHRRTKALRNLLCSRSACLVYHLPWFCSLLSLYALVPGRLTLFRDQEKANRAAALWMQT